MLPPRNGPRALRRDALHHLLVGARADVRALRLRRERDGRHRTRVRVDERALAPVPLCQELVRGRGPDQAWVRHACKLYAGDVARGRVDACGRAECEWEGGGGAR